MHEPLHGVVPTVTGITFQSMHKVGTLIPQILQQKMPLTFLAASLAWFPTDGTLLIHFVKVYSS